MFNSSLSSSQEVRYFVEEYNNIETLEASLDSSPGDVALWIKLARLKLHQNNNGNNVDDEDSYQDNVTQALSSLSRGLEENTQSEVFILCCFSKTYLHKSFLNGEMVVPDKLDAACRLQSNFETVFKSVRFH